MLTSAQYANLLLKKLQVYFSCSDAGYRAYLANFFGSIFCDPSVVLTEETYQNFITLMESEIDYAAKNDLYSLSALHDSDRFDSTWTVLESSFLAIGVTLEMTENADGPDSLIFTLPSGEKRIWYCQDYNDYVRVNSQLRVTEDYRRHIRSFYALENEDGELTEELSKVAGSGTRWSFDDDTGELTISGEGSLANENLWKELGISSDINTMVIGAGVRKLDAKSMNLITGKRFVFLHGSTDDIVIDSSAFGTSKIYRIYTDNETVKNHDFGTSVTIQWHPLADWKNIVEEPIYYYYGTIRRPALPEWDKKTYPYAIIANSKTLFTNTHYLYISASPFYYDGSNVYQQAVAGMHSHSSAVGWGEWKETEITEAKTRTTIWTNTDILNTTDNSVYLAATEPVPDTL